MKKYLVFMGLAGLLMGGCTLPFLNTSMNKQSSSDTSMKQDANQPFSGPLAQAVALGVPMKCTYGLLDGSMAEGYIKGKQYAGEMAMPDGKVGNVIVKDECMYSWEDGAKTGISFCFQGESGNPDGTDYTIWDDTQANVPSNVNVSCEPSTVNDETFLVPPDVSFTSMDEMMQGLGDTIQNSASDMMKMSDEDVNTMQQKAQDMMDQLNNSTQQ